MKQKIILILVFLGVASFIYSQENSLSLQNAVQTALENNYNIIVSEKNLEVNQVNNSWANTGALPTVSFVGSGAIGNNYNDNDDYNSKSFNASVDLNWVIFRGFSARITKDKLEEYENMSDANLAIMVENTIQNVISAYYNVLLEQEKLKISESNMILSSDRYQRELQKKEIGTAVTYDLLQSQNSFLSDTADFMMSEASHRNAMRQLNYLMSVPVNEKYTFTTSFTSEQSDFAFEELLSKMESNNTTLQNQYINLELSKLDVQSAKSAYYP
ncbi:MAG: TolC family protein, partial [Bacteroidales bacterium]|nr:TolC family protein [Bacteroidales bacterium]